jgi:hypothetical protein
MYAQLRQIDRAWGQILILLIRQQIFARKIWALQTFVQSIQPLATTPPRLQRNSCNVHEPRIVAFTSADCRPGRRSRQRQPCEARVPQHALTPEIPHIRHQTRLYRRGGHPRHANGGTLDLVVLDILPEPFPQLCRQVHECRTGIDRPVLAHPGQESDRNLTQTMPAHRHPLRQARRQLSCIRQARANPTHASRV